MGTRQERLTRWLLDDQIDRIHGFFEENGVERPIIVWNPPQSTPMEAPLHTVLEHWLELRGDQIMPRPGELDPSSIRSALGRVLLLDVLADERDFRYRLYGTVMAARMGLDLTGSVVSQFAPGEYIGDFYCAVYLAMCERREAVFTCHYPSQKSYARQIKRVLLPLGERGKVTRILGCIESEAREPIYPPRMIKL